ncbi:MAG: alpha/beta hydrolase [Verrucomicrobiae bacterium]|nr:alpha/beta hydrolase [Verrucomicrobiae bacterium]
MSPIRLVLREIRHRKVNFLLSVLGAAVAVAVATQRKTYALILESGASSLVAVAQRAYPWLPVWFLMFDRFRSDQWIAKVRAPLLMLHGEEDSVVPIDLGRDLFKLANDPKNFAPFLKAGHNDLWQNGAGRAAIEFLQAVQKPPI